MLHARLPARARPSVRMGVIGGGGGEHSGAVERGEHSGAVEGGEHSGADLNALMSESESAGELQPEEHNGADVGREGSSVLLANGGDPVVGEVLASIMVEVRGVNGCVKVKSLLDTGSFRQLKRCKHIMILFQSPHHV